MDLPGSREQRHSCLCEALRAYLDMTCPTNVHKHKMKREKEKKIYWLQRVSKQTLITVGEVRVCGGYISNRKATVVC